jgi:hypothetical protein
VVTLKEIRGDSLLPDVYVATIAAGSVGEAPGFVVPWNALVTAVRWVPSAAITANGTNYFTLILRNRGGAGAGATQPATRSYAATNSVAFVSELMTLSSTATDLQLAAGDVLSVQKTEAGTGLTMPIGTVQVYLRAR